MKYNPIKYTFLTALFALITLNSCVDKEIETPKSVLDDLEIPEGIRNGYSINLTVTLDKMGGHRAANIANPLEEVENYIDPAKFRVLFFDNNDKFLFESRSRWVKKLDSNSSNSEWLVSVPVFTYGNDVYEVEDENGNKRTIEWDWDRIRNSLIENSFKIAILANRPEIDWYPSFTDIDIPAHWYDNQGPFWTPDSTGVVDVFGLHHCQYDPMYHGKSKNSYGVGFYDFIMKDWDPSLTATTDTYKTMQPKMGATASWVNWDDERSLKDFDDTPMTDGTLRYTLLPSYKHPIPMYGIQEFAPIQHWIKGTPFNLSNIISNTEGEYDYQSIAMLRSVVRLDLMIPKSSYPQKPRLVGLWYPNIYSRCEPMDVWTPTDQIWRDDHNNCEWKDIMNYGLISSKTETKGGTNRYTNNKLDFQKTMSWFYGAWLEKGWEFKNSENIDVKPEEIPGLSYPRIFNTCIQRNKFVLCNVEGDVSDLYNDDYWHFVAYTGERNMVDPNDIPRMVGSNAYTITWMFKDEYNNKNNYYCIPIADYSKSQSYAINSFGPYTTADFNSSSYNLPSNTNNHISDYGNNLRDNVTAIEEMPWPLLRNHIYRITIAGSNLTDSYLWDFTQPVKTPTSTYLDNDANWTNPRYRKIVHLSWYAEAEDKKTKPDLEKDNSTYNNVAKWTINDQSYSITKKAATSDIANGNVFTVDGKNYTSIKTTPNVQNILQLPKDIQAIKVTLYSFINVDVETSPIFTANVIATSAKSFAPNDVNNPELIGTDVADITGGKMYAINGQSNAMNLINRPNNNSGTPYYFVFTNSNTGFKIELDTPLIAGDIISATFTNNAHGATISTDDTNDSPFIQNSFNYTVKAGDGLAGEKTIYLYRYTGSTTYFTDFKISRPQPRTPTYWSEINGREYDYSETIMGAYRKTNQDYDSFEFTCDKLSTITFTNGGEQCSYVVFVEVEDTRGPDCWEYNQSLNGEMKADNNYIPQLKGLQFKDNGTIQIYDTDPSKIRLTGNATITFPQLKHGSQIIIEGLSAYADATERSIAPATGSLLSFVAESSSSQTNGKCIFTNDGESKTFKWIVDNPNKPDEFVDVVFQLSGGGIDFSKFQAEVSTTSNRSASISGGNSGLKIKSEDFHSESIRFR